MTRPPGNCGVAGFPSTWSGRTHLGRPDHRDWPGRIVRGSQLLRHGVKPRIVERRLAPHGETRGTALQPAVLEILARGGLIEPFLRAGVRIRHIQILGPGLREIGTANFEDIGCEYEFQCSLPQWRTEAILREHLECLGLVIEYGTDVRLIEDHPAGLRVTLEARGTAEVLTTAYVLGVVQAVPTA